MLKFATSMRIMCVLGLPALIGAQTGFKYWDPTDTSQHAPALLSQTGLYSNITTKKLIADAIKFDVNSALWSDGTAKARWILLKKNTNGTYRSVTFREKDDYWDYPDSTVFIKQFAVDTVPGDTTTRRLWETRLLINKKMILDSLTGFSKDTWYGYSYQWRANQLDADLISVEDGKNDTVRYYPNGKTQPGKWKKWRFPSMSDCGKCHRSDQSPDTVHARSILGFFTAQLNKPMGPGNQLDSLFTKGVLKVAKPADRPANWNNSPRWFNITDSVTVDPRNTLDARARGYIASNCSGCHGLRGVATGAAFGMNLNYDFHEMAVKMELRNKTTSWPFTLDEVEPLNVEAALIVPGFPQKSVILFRQISRDTAANSFDGVRTQMPPLASFEGNMDAWKVMAQWVIKMPPLAGVLPSGARFAAVSPLIQGSQLILPQSMIGKDNAKVSMTGLNGRTFRLSKLGRGVYAIPAGLSSGVYIIRVDNLNFTRYLF